MAISSQDGLIAARTGKRQTFSFAKISTANMIAGGLCSLYRATSQIPTQPAIPTVAEVPTKALSFNFNNAIAPDSTHLDFMGGVCTVAGVVNLYDRTFHIGGLNGTVTTAQTVNSQTVLTFPTRNTTAFESEWFLEWYADTGATAVTANVAVTYTDATTGTIAVSLAATMRIGRILPIIPASGKWIASVQTVTLSATTGTAGNFGVTCGDRISNASLYIPIANVGSSVEAVLSIIPDNACLWQVQLCSATTSGDLRGELILIQG